MMPALQRLLTRDVVLLFLILLGARIVFLVDGQNGQFFHDLVMDERVHWDWAATILEHGTLDGAFFRAPLYSYLLAGFRVVFLDSIFLSRLVTSLAGILIAILVFKLTRELTGSRVWAWAAALIYGLGTEILFFDTRLLSDQLAALLMLLALYAVAKDRSPLLIGGLIGAASLARPLALILLPLWFGWVALSKPNLRSLSKNTALVLGSFLLVVSPVTVINYLKSNDFVLIAWNGGVNFFIGNNPRSDGMTAVHWDFRKDWWGSYHDFITHAERDLGRDLKPSEVSSYWYSQGVEFITEDTGAALILTLRKARLYFTGVEISNNIAITPYIEDATPLFSHLPNPIRLFMLFYASCVVAVVTARSRSTLLLLSVYALVYAAVNIAFFITSRYRLPVIPVLVVIGAHALWQISGDLRRRWPHLLALALYTSLVFSFNIPPSYPAYHVAVANTHLQRGELDAAEQSFNKVFEYARHYPQVYEGLAMVAEGRGEPAAAIPLYEQELAVSGNDFSSYRLAALYYDAQQPDRAYTHSSRIKDRYEDAAVLHAKVCIALRRFDEAQETLLANLAKDFAVEDSEYLLGMVYLLEGRPEAEAILDKYRDHPKFDRLRQLREMLRRQQGRPAQPSP
jgi:4-amino-4-deoxy-L-arabinose transferase-like glycosyltransferase